MAHALVTLHVAPVHACSSCTGSAAVPLLAAAICICRFVHRLFVACVSFHACNCILWCAVNVHHTWSATVAAPAGMHAAAGIFGWVWPHAARLLDCLPFRSALWSDLVSLLALAAISVAAAATRLAVAVRNRSVGCSPHAAVKLHPHMILANVLNMRTLREGAGSILWRRRRTRAYRLNGPTAPCACRGDCPQTMHGTRSLTCLLICMLLARCPQAAGVPSPCKAATAWRFVHTTSTGCAPPIGPPHPC